MLEQKADGGLEDILWNRVALGVVALDHKVSILHQVGTKCLGGWLEFKADKVCHAHLVIRSTCCQHNGHRVAGLDIPCINHANFALGAEEWNRGQVEDLVHVAAA